MPLIVNGASLLLGSELEFVERGHIVIEQGLIKSAGRGNHPGKDALDGRGFLIIPGFINAHTHIADGIGRDIASGSGLERRVHPVFGAKKKILETSRPEHLKEFIRTAAVSMMKKGIVAFADFREGGTAGVALLKDALEGLPIRCVALGRTGYYASPDASGGIPDEHAREASQVVATSGGLGISGANENSDSALAQYRRIAGAKLVAIHAAESKETVEYSKDKTGLSEVARAVRHLRPDLLVHMTNASDNDIALAAESRIGIVICPRANGVLGVGVPRVAAMLRAGCLVAVGTDNVMLNSPDIHRELDYIWKTSRALEGEMLSPRDVLKMATVNPAKMLRLNSGWIEEGRSADLIFVDRRHADLYPMHDPHAALVHRLSESAISAVMIGGSFVETVN